MPFTLNDRLAQGGFNLGKIGINTLLLKNNSLYPWFILVPEVDDSIIDLHQLNSTQYQSTCEAIYKISQFIETQFPIKKVNVGAIGNLVPQLHIHLIGRSEDDLDWPNPVWGTSHKKVYDSNEVEDIRRKISNFIGL